MPLNCEKPVFLKGNRLLVCAAVMLVSLGCQPEAHAQSSAPRALRSHPRTQSQARSLAPIAPIAPTRAAPPMAAVASRTVSTLTSILRDGRVLSYRHDTRVDVRAGRYEFDCSGMIDWVLAQSAPVARRESRARTHGARPLAADYARLFLATSSQPRRTNPRGWARVERVQDAMPGDVLAWIRPRIVQSNNTGHVVFVMAPPEAIPGEPDAWLVRIADSSRYTHQDDTREGLGRTGLGVGTLLVIADPVTGAPRAYGWFGARTPREWVLQTQIAIARPVR